MQLDLTLAFGEVVEGVAVRTTDGRLELRPIASPSREATQPPLDFEPSFFTLPSVIVVADEQGRDVSVEVRQGEVGETLDLAMCVVPASWPRGIEVAARAYVGQAGSLVLDEPRCFICGGTGVAPAPQGWIGGFGAACPPCRVCGGSGDYVVKAAPTGDDVEVVP
jgi:hypothetical protein